MTEHRNKIETDELDKVPMRPMIPATEIYDCDSFPIYIVTDSEFIRFITVDPEEAEEMATYVSGRTGDEWHVVCRSASLGPPKPPTLSRPKLGEEFTLGDDDLCDEVPF